jgi:hypothetical protein
MQLAAVVRCRNDVVPVFRLPAEILLQIFLELVTDYHVESVGLLDRLNFSHVCATWRRTALEMGSTLWAYIPDRNEEVAQEFIIRSRNAPLVVDFCGGKGGELPILHLALCHLHRIRELTIKIHGSDKLRGLKKSFTGPALLLETFTLSLRRQGAKKILPRSQYMSGVSPNVREVLLKNCAIAWAPPQLHNLTTLTLNEPWRDEMGYWDDLFKLLRRSPNLQELDLFNATPVVPFPGFASGSPGGLADGQVLLRHLRRLRMIATESDSCAYLLGAMDMPGLARFSLNLKSDGVIDFTPTGKRTMAQVGSHILANGAFGPLHKIHITLNSKKEDLIVCWTGGKADKEDGSPSVSFSFPFIDPFLPAFSLATLQEICLKAEAREGWDHIFCFSSLPSVQRLVLGGAVASFAFLETFAQGGQTPWRGAPWPGLRTLHIWAYEERHEHPPNDFISRMVNLMATRKGMQPFSLEVTCDDGGITDELEERLLERKLF